MAYNDLAVRFTENYYATKNEVSKELKISVIDGVWDKILSYRSPFNQYLAVRGIDKNQLRVCLCLTISNKSKQLELRLEHLLNEYAKLDHVNGDAQHYMQSNFIKCLQNIAAKRNLVGDEEIIRGITQGNRLNRDLANYYDALKFIEENYSLTIDVDFLAELFSLVTGNTELTYFYRDIDNEDVNSSSIISRVYKSAPHALIESMMDGLFTFIARGNLSPINKSIITYYYVQFVKPFKTNNNEIATLMAKAVLAHYVGSFASCIPLEALLNDNVNEVNKLFGEVQATSDLTYYLTYALDSVSHIIEKMIDGLAEYTVVIMKNDFFRLDEEKEEEIVSEPEEKTFTPVVEEVKAKETPVVEEIVKPAPKVETPKPTKVEVTNEPRGLAVSFIPEELDEKTASRLEKHLLELDVRLSKKQAYFYARHCTLGMYYTIDQFKKSTKCVYETARTSMEKLAEFGYYKKQPVGKKFVYTPVERK